MYGSGSKHEKMLTGLKLSMTTGLPRLRLRFSLCRILVVSWLLSWVARCMTVTTHDHPSLVYVPYIYILICTYVHVMKRIYFLILVYIWKEKQTSLLQHEFTHMQNSWRRHTHSWSVATNGWKVPGKCLWGIYGVWLGKWVKDECTFRVMQANMRTWTRT